MERADFWSEPAQAQKMIAELQTLKDEAAGAGAWERGSAILSVVAGAGGDDAEDFASMLLEMYRKYAERQGWSVRILHENKNTQGGYRNASVEIVGKGAYGVLKNEY